MVRIGGTDGHGIHRIDWTSCSGDGGGYDYNVVVVRRSRIGQNLCLRAKPVQSNHLTVTHTAGNSATTDAVQFLPWTTPAQP